jgi:DNA-binding beta-propeller fold protein YncE
MLPDAEGRRREEERGSRSPLRGLRGAAGALLAAGALALGAAAPAGAVPSQAPSDPLAGASIGFEPIPLSLATDSLGHVYMTNVQWMSTILQYSDAGELLASWGQFTASSGFQARGIATDAAGDVWVADEVGGKVVELGTDGSVLRSWPAKAGAIAIGTNGDVYLLEDDQVDRRSPDGTLISTWGSKNGSGGKFTEPFGIATAPNGDVYVADTYGDKIESFDAEGNFLHSFGGYGYGPGLFTYPYGLAVSPTNGEVYVTDTAGDRIVIFSGEGNYVGTFGHSGGRPGHFFTPTAVTVDPQGNVYVADAGQEYPDDGTARVQKFTAAGKFVAQWGYVPPVRPKLDATVRGRRAVFHFTSGQAGATFECRLDGRDVPKRLKRYGQPCRSSKRYAHLRPGRKIFEVATVLGGHSGPPRRYRWTVPGSPR